MILFFVATVNSSKSIVKQGWFWTLAFFIHEVRRSKKALKNHPETVQKSMKIQPKMESRTHPNENPSPRPSSESILAPFCPHLGSILAPISLPKPSKSLPRALWKKHLMFIKFWRSPPGNVPGCPGGSRGVPHLVKARVFDEISVLASTGSKILKMLILRATLPREKSL